MSDVSKALVHRTYAAWAHIESSLPYARNRSKSKHPARGKDSDGISQISPGLTSQQVNHLFLLGLNDHARTSLRTDL
jgi:hypothetical protein